MPLQLDELDYYALLGVSEDAGVQEIKRAFRAFAERRHPDLFAGDPGRVAEATRIYRRATEAYRVLTHTEQRRRYDEQRKQGKRRLDPLTAGTASLRPGAASGRPDAVPPRARPFLTRAEQALAAGDLMQARLNFRIALQHDPGNEQLRRRLAEIEDRLTQR